MAKKRPPHLTAIEGGKKKFDFSDPFASPPPRKNKFKRKAEPKADVDDTEGKDVAKSGKGPRWRETRADGTPAASFENARRAIGLLGIECRYDLFHDRMMICQRDGKALTVDHALLGNITDGNILMLRQKISSEFGFDPKDQHVRDAVQSMALERCYDPVLDLLDEAQGAWDGAARIDRFAVDYMNTEDTALNRACGRKMLMAMVRRARHPGCKWDTVVVFEGDEGLGKSTALRVLAGDDNFSDESIIGRDSKEMLEHAAGVWLHESADLAGMTKRQVEEVKAWASRQVDRGRPAYAHLVKEQPRRCVMAATTNNNEYLQSQTGNRRFWPLKVLKPIDIEILKADRLQLLGEAAHYEAQGESLFLDESLWADAAVEQEKRRVKDSWEDILEAEYIDVAHVIDGEEREERISTKDIVEELLKIPAAQQTTGLGMRLSNVMHKLGWLRKDNNNVVINGKSVKGYYRPTTRELPETRKQVKPHLTNEQIREQKATTKGKKA